MSEFDDPELERLLGGASGAYPDTNTALEAVRGRVRTVRRRRAIAASSAACALLFVGAVLAAQRGDDRGGLHPGDDIADTATSRPDTVAPTTVDTTASSTRNTSEPTGGASTTPTVPTSTSISISTATSTVTSTSNGHGGSGGPGSGSSPGGPGTTTPSNAGPSTTTYHAIGGSIVVHFQNGVLTLVSSTPDSANGYQVESGALTAGDRVEVKFNNGTHTSVIRIDVVNGAPQPRIDEHG